jgi:hypothetical protein
LISAAWTRSLYELYWKPRTCILTRENYEATNAEEKKRQRIQRDIKTAKAKARAKAKAKTNALFSKPKPLKTTSPDKKATQPYAISPTKNSPYKLRKKLTTLKHNRTKVDQTFTKKLIKIITRAGPVVQQTKPALNLTQNPDTPNFIHEPPDKIVK